MSIGHYGESGIQYFIRLKPSWTPALPGNDKNQSSYSFQEEFLDIYLNVSKSKK